MSSVTALWSEKLIDMKIPGKEMFINNYSCISAQC